MQEGGYTGQFPLHDVAYDVVAVLYEKSKALEAYDKFLSDLEGNDELKQIFERIRQDDYKHIEELRGCLPELLNKPQQGS